MTTRRPRSDSRTFALLLGIALAISAFVMPARASVAAPRAAGGPPVWLAGLDGGVFALGSAPFRGSLGGTRQDRPVIAIAGRPTGNGYWITTLDGVVRAFGDAPFRGDLRGTRLNQPLVDFASTHSGDGYWLVASDGGVFTFGNARFLGSLGGIRLNQPISGLVPTPTGKGYWLVAADGGVFTFGDARFFGSLGGRPPAQPIATLAATPTGRGYWLLGRDGRVYRFGDAAMFGDAIGTRSLAVSIVPTKSGAGYWIASADGQVRAFGNAARVALPPIRLNAPIAGMATPWASSSGIALPLEQGVNVFAPPGYVRTWAGPHEVALTFDDGPSSYTPAVLAVLARYGVQATFFTVGYVSATRPDLLAAEARAGMSVEVHAWDHPDLTRLSPAAIDDQLTRAADLVQRVTGRRPSCFRPPYGSTNATVAAEGFKLGLAQILWNVDPSDYKRPGASTIASRVLSQATGRGLVVGIHDGGGDRSQTVAALPSIIEGMRARGYTFVRLCV